MKFDPFGLSVKDLTTKNVIVISNSIGLLYTMRPPGSLTPSSNAVAALAVVPHALTIVAPTTWHHRLGHPGPDTLSSLSRSYFIQCTSNKHDFCHVRNRTLTLIEREDDSRSWSNFLVYFSHNAMPT
jgi:hypothetical protein